MGKNLRDDKTARERIYSVCRNEIAFKPVLVLVSVGVFHFLRQGARGCAGRPLLKAHEYRRFSLLCALVRDPAK
jgi:hypothetical protein